MPSPAPSSAPSTSCDPRLQSFLDAPPAAAERLLAEILTGDVDRIVRGVIHRTLGGPTRGHRMAVVDADDVRSDVLLQLVARLRGLKARGGEAIAHLPAYVATIAYRTCYNHLRRLYPERARLKNRVRYAVTWDSGLTMATDALGIWRVGLAAWADALVEPDLDAAMRFRADPGGYARALVPDLAADQLGLGDAIRILLGQVGQPVELDLLVDAVAGLLGVVDRRAGPLAEDATPAVSARLLDQRASAAALMVHREYLAQVWTELLDLPVRQRVAILLNLRDDEGRSALATLPLVGIASVRAIAAALDMSPVELGALWRLLPIDDKRIAARLGITRQEVINLRKSGRARLARRMARFGTP